MIQLHQLAFPLHVILKVHHNKGQKLLHNHKDMKLQHNKGKDNNLNLKSAQAEVRKKKADRPPSNVWENFIKK